MNCSHVESLDPVIKSFEPGEHWVWCYVDELMLETSP